MVDNAMREAFATEARRMGTRSNLNKAFRDSDNRKAINDIRALARQAFDKIRGDASLSELGKKQLIARTWLNARDEIARLSEADTAEQRARYDQLEKQVFGIDSNDTTAIVSYRDAVEKTRSFDKEDDALDALGTAELSGDRAYSAAILLRAWQKRWNRVIDTHTRNHPLDADALTELRAIATRRDSQASNLGGSMNATLQRPAELAGTVLSEISSLAATAPELTQGAANNRVTTGVYNSAQMQRVYGR